MLVLKQMHKNDRKNQNIRNISEEHFSSVTPLTPIVLTLSKHPVDGRIVCLTRTSPHSL